MSDYLQDVLTRTLESYPDRTALEDGDTEVSYAKLAEVSDRLRDRLQHLGVRPGDRVGMYLHKSADAVMALFGILKAGAVYVPVDAAAPAARNAYILHDCAVKAVVLEATFVDALHAEWLQVDEVPALLILGTLGGGRGLEQMLGELDASDPAAPSAAPALAPDALAYILYTSGSTGKPKGVAISHCAALAFIDWCSATFQPRAEDRFSSHAPFHFDLSIHDIYVPLKHGATLVLIAEDVGKDPARLAPFIAAKRLSVWYSAPSILSMLVQYGRLERYDLDSLRTVLFAGEVFPIKHLRALKQRLPGPDYYNLYGPTETNVCTYFKVPEHISDERRDPYPIGSACAHYEIRVLDDEGRAVERGQEGELCASGPGLMEGYWHLPERTEAAFLRVGGKRWYRTGDIVRSDENGDYVYLGRRDRMVKKRGYRIELGEIEAALYRHEAVEEAAVIALADEGGVLIKAFLSCSSQPSLIALKAFCMAHLPAYMVPDLFAFGDIPKTSTDKTDYQKLSATA